MPPRLIPGLEGLRALIGQRLGSSEWYDVTQERVTAFADATGDHQWIHIDPVRAKTESPYGTTIAHGFFTLSLAIALSDQAFRVEGVKMIVNYGLNRVRFPSSVKVGARILLHVYLQEIVEASQGVQAPPKQQLFDRRKLFHCSRGLARP